MAGGLTAILLSHSIRTMILDIGIGNQHNEGIASGDLMIAKAFAGRRDNDNQCLFISIFNELPLPFDGIRGNGGFAAGLEAVLEIGCSTARHMKASMQASAHPFSFLSARDAASENLLDDSLGIVLSGSKIAW